MHSCQLTMTHQLEASHPLQPSWVRPVSLSEVYHGEPNPVRPMDNPFTSFSKEKSVRWFGRSRRIVRAMCRPVSVTMTWDCLPFGFGSCVWCEAMSETEWDHFTKREKHRGVRAAVRVLTQAWFHLLRVRITSPPNPHDVSALATAAGVCQPMRFSKSYRITLTCSSSALIARSAGFVRLSCLGVLENKTRSRRRSSHFTAKATVAGSPLQRKRTFLRKRNCSTLLNQAVSDSLRCCGNCLQVCSVHIDQYKTRRSFVCHHSRHASQAPC